VVAGFVYAVDFSVFATFCSYGINLLAEVTISIYTILAPIVGAAVMIGMTPSATDAERMHISKQACIVGGALLMVFAVAGNFIMESVFKISTHAFQVGGGLYLLTIAAGMVVKKEEEVSEAKGEVKPKSLGNIAITPIGTPLLVGPGTITATLVKKSTVCKTSSDMVIFFLALGLVMFLAYLTFVVSCKFAKLLTPKVLGVIEKAIGLILACMALESIMAGISTFLFSM
jgi:multiple antibiotic resistance protein